MDPIVEFYVASQELKAIERDKTALENRRIVELARLERAKKDLLARVGGNIPRRVYLVSGVAECVVVTHGQGVEVLPISRNGAK